MVKYNKTFANWDEGTQMTYYDNKKENEMKK